MTTNWAKVSPTFPTPNGQDIPDLAKTKSTPNDDPRFPFTRWLLRTCSAMKKNDPYGALKFGEFRKYMQNKQAKLKEQERDLLNDEGPEFLFKGLSMYINGYTEPPHSELRRMIIQYGGDFQHYLKKQSVTHIIATNLTNAKMIEFRAYKVVTPRWIVDSIASKRLLPWSDYRVFPKDTKQKQLAFPALNEDTPKGADLNAALLSNEWAREASSVNPNFIQKYYQSSRLHYLSTWKAELRDIVRNMERQHSCEASQNNKRKRVGDYQRILMHVDFDCFFASVGIKDRPDLKELPVAVSHGKGMKDNSSSDIASCNYVARKFGVCNGMPIGQAKELCPDLHLLPYEFEKYRSISEIFYKILFQCADQVQAVSVDEALIDVSSHIAERNIGQEERLASKIRSDIREQTGCEASIGIGPNILLARLATKKAKPQNQYFCRIENAVDFMMKQDIDALPGVGYVMEKKLKEAGIGNVADLSKVALHNLQEKFGPKQGETLYNFARGIDNRPLSTNQPRNSVSAEVNWGVRFENDKQADSFLEDLSKEVHDRLEKIGCKGKSITIKVMRRKIDAGEASKHLGHGSCDSFSKSVTLDNFTDDAHIISNYTKEMFHSLNFSVSDVRGIGIQIRKLNNTQEEDVEKPNQRILPFLPEPKGGIQKNDALLQSSINELPHQTAEQKQTMRVDRTVYFELPAALQKDLVDSYHLEFIQDEESQEGNNLPEVQMPSSIEKDTQTSDSENATQSLPQLPPWSQLDPSSLLALPNRMRKQILEAYSKASHGNKSENRSKPEKPERVSKRVKTDKRSGESSRRTLNTLTQMLGRSSPNRFVDDGDYFSSVLDADAAQYQSNNVYKDLSNAHEHGRGALEIQSGQVGNRLLDKSLPAFGTPSWIRPTLMGRTDLDDIRLLLKEWVASCDDPDPEDTKAVGQYIVALLRDKDLEKAQLVVMYLETLTKSKSSIWRSCISTIRGQLSTQIRLQYQCDLRE